ncbi:MAG: molecular chaperone DnaK [Candidatus Organicella extenuata]|uniref:Chaperone protein DnaK n=1 Tax=Candidatus Organicella extenuata TaxID=2841811 RepID=A0AA51BKU1_9BACT|nr:MAG: molecular chaperone DnaK [Candidatus Organicella extenuata]
MSKEIILGIDLGTTNSCMSIMEGKEPTVIPNSEGSRTTPSIVAFGNKGEQLVGQSAKRQIIMNPKNTIFSAKRLMGRKFSEVSNDIKNLPYKVIEGKNGNAVIECTIDGSVKIFTPEQISAIVLRKLKEDAELYIGKSVNKAVITVPAYFNDAQRQTTKDAGKIAGLEVIRIINEPTAASLAYGLDKRKDEKIAVYDLGGGTFDVSIMEIGDGVFEVKATNGDTQLGGDNWDSEVISWLINNFKTETGINLLNDSTALQRLREEVEKAKIALSSTQETDINLPFISANSEGPKHLNIKLSRSKFEQICDHLYKKTIVPFKECLRDAKLKNQDINELVLVGGMTRSPKIIAIAEELTGKKPNKGVNPDEVVSIGAAIQGAVLQGNVSDVLLLDVTPLTLGIETAGGVCTPMIEKNTTIPSKKVQTFTTYADNQTGVDIKILQGERPLANDNKMLGTFRLDGIPSAPRGVPQIEVTFDINADGILKVKAKDLGTNKDQNIVITGASGLSQEEIEQFKKEAEDNSKEDKKKQQLIESKNSLDNLIYQTEKQLKDLDSKIKNTSLKKGVVDLINESKLVLNNKDSSVDSIKKVSNELTNKFQELSKDLNANTNTEDSSKSKPKDEGVVDGEVIDDKTTK